MLPKVHSHRFVLFGKTEIEEGSEEMVIGTDVDTLKCQLIANNLLQIFDTIASKEVSMNVKKFTCPILEATLLMVVVSFYPLEPKVPPFFLNALLVNVTEASIVFYLQLLLSQLHLWGSTFQWTILKKMFMLDILSLSMVMVLEKGRRNRVKEEDVGSFYDIRLED